MTAHEALSHPFVGEGSHAQQGEADLLPVIKQNFNARRTLHAAIDTIRAINKLREVGSGGGGGANDGGGGGGGIGGLAAAMMSGAMSLDPRPGGADQPSSSAKMEIDGQDQTRANDNNGFKDGGGSGDGSGGGDEENRSRDGDTPMPDHPTPTPTPRLFNVTANHGLWSRQAHSR